MKKAHISYAFYRLNHINNGEKKFEQFCKHLIPLFIDINFHPSSGSDSGGDGGIDGWSHVGESGKIKYAFSINTSVSYKIKEEINKTDRGQYKEIRFFTNQPIKQKAKEDFYKYYKEDSEINLTIYDQENLVDFVYQHEELGQFIDLPKVLSGITIEYLIEHNQLLFKRDEIAQYIPRLVTVWDDSQKKYYEKELLDYIAVLPKFTIMQAPAGYGKTCALQQLHQKILEGDIDIFLPPVFIGLAYYTPGSLLKMINEGLRVSGDYQCRDFLLLLDGYDEIKDTEKELLLKELAQLIHNTSEIRKVIVTVRENTYSKSDFELFPDLTLTTLSRLTNNDIKTLFFNESILIANESDFFNNTFFNEFSDNIFYVVKFIEYYKVNHSIADNVTDLFSYIIEQEINRLFRNEKADEAAIESLSLYMSLNQLTYISDKNIIGNLGIILPSMPFKFSHKSIQEYLAARKIAKQELTTITNILAKGNLIIPHLTNTVGFVLNILNSTDTGQSKFTNMVEWCLQGEGNAKRLLQIEADKIDPDMNHDIFKSVIDQESRVGDFFNHSDFLVQFALMPDSRNKNIEYLVNAIINFKSSDNYHYYTSVLLRISYHHLDCIKDTVQKSLINYFITLVESENIESNSNLINSLLFSISHFPELEKLNDNQIFFIIERLLSIQHHENIFNNACQFLITAKTTLKIKTYFQLFEFLLNSVLSERGQTAHWVPTQTYDDTYNEPMRITHWDSFIPLTREFLKERAFLVWEVLEHVIERQKEVKEQRSSRSEFDELFSFFYSAAIEDIYSNGINDRKENIVIDWISGDIGAYHDESILWKNLLENPDLFNLQDIVKEVIIKTGQNVFYKDFIDYYHNEVIITEKKFNIFQKEFHESNNEALKSFFDSFCRHLPEEHRLHDYVYSNMPESLKEKIEEAKSRMREWQRKDEIREKALSEDFHIAFDRIHLIEEVYAIFNDLGSDKVSRDVFFESDSPYRALRRNQFALFLFGTSFSDDVDVVKKYDLIESLNEENWNINFMLFFIQYIGHYNVKIEALTESERQHCIEWVKVVLDKYSLETIDSTLRRIHITLSYILRNFAFLRNDKEFTDSYTNKIFGLIFSGFPNVIYGSYSVSYDTYSLEYLEPYISPKKIISFIEKNFTHAFNDYNKMISVCGYIAGHIDEVLPYQKNKMREEITNYIESNLKSFYYPTITDCAFALGFQLSDLDENKLAKSFFLDDKGYDLNYNYASSFLKYKITERTQEERAHLIKSLRVTFNNCSEEFLKKTIAEYYINLVKNAGDIFLYYVNYILSDDRHPILTEFINHGNKSYLYTEDISHLKKIEKLFLYSREKKEPDDRRSGIMGIALSSYIAMAANVQTREELNKILDSMRYVAERGNDFIYQQIQEIENAFAKRTYKPLSIREILELD